MQIGKIFEKACVSVKFGFICRFSFCLPHLTSRDQQESYLFQGVLAGQPKQQLNQLSLLQWRKSQTLKSRIKFYFNYSAGDDTGEVLLTTAISLSRTISVAYFRQQLKYVFYLKGNEQSSFFLFPPSPTSFFKKLPKSQRIP